MPSYVCSALVHATQAAGAIPVLTDVAGVSGNMDDPPHDMGGCVAAIVPHMFGRPAAATAELAKRLPVIEDLAMALGADGVGGLGVAAVCSFFATKVITTGGEGGMVLTDDAGFAQMVAELREYDGLPVDRRRWNYKLTDVGAAVGRVQLRRLPELLQRRRALAARYDDACRRWSAHRPPATAADISYRYVLTLEPARLHDSMAAFEALGIAARRPVGASLHAALDVAGSFPGTQLMLATALSLPLYPSLSEDQVQQVIAAADQVLGA